MSLNSIIVDKLKFFGLKLGIVETSTNGMICSNFAMLKNYDEVLDLGLVLSSFKKAKLFAEIDEKNYLSRNNARMLAKTVVDEYECDISLCVLSSSNDLNAKDVIKDQTGTLKDVTGYTGHAFISVYVGKQYHDFELRFKTEDDLKDRLLLTNKAMGELLSVVLNLK